MKGNTRIDWKQVKVVIFDVDGTLYDQSKLRGKMLLALLQYYMWRPWRLQDVRMLAHFRSEREKRAGVACADLENAQYRWCAEKGGYPVDKVKEVVERWMFDYPNQFLAGCRYPGTKAFFDLLLEKGIKIAIYSDYQAQDKLKAMELPADLIISSTDPQVDRLKPDPTGLFYIARHMGVSPQDCVFIGDRYEMDGECASKAGMPFLIIDKGTSKPLNFYLELTDHLTQIN
jgi:HAD superfamily hydrolase (TIGR01549 family)